MGYHASMPFLSSSNSSENEISDTVEPQKPLPGKYFLATGKEYPYCRKYLFFCGLQNSVYSSLIESQRLLKCTKEILQIRKIFPEARS